MKYRSIAIAISFAFLAGCAAGPSGMTPFASGGTNALKSFAGAGKTAKITEFAIAVGSGPAWVAKGPQHMMWFTLPGTYPSYTVNSIGKISSIGTQTSYIVPIPQAGLASPIEGPDGAIWFAEYQAGKIGRMTADGKITNEYSLTKMNPVFMTVGPDGAIWFGAQAKTGEIGRITMQGKVSKFPVPGDPVDIIVGPDGALWFTELNGAIGRMTTSGSVTTFTIPTKKSTPLGIASGPDGNLWFTESTANKIGRLTPSGTFTEFIVPTKKSGPNLITAGPDGALWFTENLAGKIGRITTSGTFTEYAIPTKKSQPLGIATGYDGAIWFTEYAGDKIGRLQPPN